VKALHAFVGPRDAGPAERQEMLDRARQLFQQEEAGDIERIDVPGRGAGEDVGGTLRSEVERIVPALQSGSLFGGKRGVLVIDAQNLQAGEAGVVADLMEGLDPASVIVALISSGSLPGALDKAVKASGERHSIKKLRERDARDWLGRAARERRLKLEPDASAALLQRFGADTAALAQALDQLIGSDGPVSGDDVWQRFRNRPEAPMWHYADALAAGDVGEALRRLSDFLTHGHPLQLLAFVESDLKRRAFASAAPTQEVLAEWLGASPDHYPVQKAWGARAQVGEDELRRALDAVARADVTLKSEPEPTHKVTMERLTVALARWYGGSRRRTAAQKRR
jgi:DNA polymerase III delta subunit